MEGVENKAIPKAWVTRRRWGDAQLV